MKTLVVILILTSFLQATIWPFDLALIIITLRAYLKSDKINLYLAYFVGLLVSLLTFSPLGFLSLIYLGLVQITSISTRSRLSGHILTVMPLVFILLLVKELIIAVAFHQSILIWPTVMIESLLALPIYLVLRFWEERFSVKDIKLKI